MSKKTIWITVMIGILGLVLLLRSFLDINDDHPKSGDRYVMAIPEHIKALDPRKSIWDVDKSLLSLIFDPLIHVGDEYTFKPGICRTWTMSPDAKRFECLIRSDVKFHDGRNVAIDDVIFSLNYILANGGLDLDDFKSVKGIKDYWKGDDKQISGIYSSGKDKLVIDLSEPAPSFVYSLASPRVVVLPNGLANMSEDEFFARPIGSGPFKLIQQNPESMLFIANKDYYKGRPFLDEIEIRPMESINALEAFKHGDVYDLRFYDFSPDDVKMVNFAKLIPTVRNSSVILYPNNSMPPFNDKRMRRLLFSMFDKKKILNMCGVAKYELDSLLPRNIAGHENVLKDKTYTFQEGMDIVKNLSKEGYKFQPIFIYYSGKRSTNDCIGEAANENFKKAGIPWRTIEVKSDEMAKIFFDGKMNADIEGIYAKNEDAYNILRYFMSDNPENVAKIDDKMVDDMLKETTNADNTYKKIEIYKNIVRRIIDGEHVYPLYEKNDVSIFNKRVKINDGTLNNPYFIDFSKVWLQ